MSNIEWTGETWNPILGCSKISAGCRKIIFKLLLKKIKNVILIIVYPSNATNILGRDKT